MGECLISGRTGESVVRSKWKFITDIITTTQDWEVPDSADISKGISVRIFGAGGGGSYWYGGGGGWMNNGIFTNLSKSEKIHITIGTGGLAGSAGGISSFGSYLSANGGKGAGTTYNANIGS